MENLIKKAMVITQRSKEHADMFDTPIAVIANTICGIGTLINGFLTLIIVLAALIADIGSVMDARIPVILIIAFLIIWVVCLKVIEIYLNYIDAQE